ncbi:MAG: hypothetical protein H7833_00360 [Magnetococcus sp. DMHC-1]
MPICTTGTHTVSTDGNGSVFLGQEGIPGQEGLEETNMSGYGKEAVMCDFEMPTLYNCERVKARKQHKCCECGKIIDIGSFYHVESGLWDGEFERYRTCGFCFEVRNFVASIDVVGCFCYGSLGDEINTFKDDIEEVFKDSRIDTNEVRRRFRI